MARIEDLLKKIDDPALREELAREVAVLKEHVDFGLVFERHIPEIVDLLYVKPLVGDLVRLRRVDSDVLLALRSPSRIHLRSHASTV